MASKFRRGAVVYRQNGQSYVVEEVDDGIVYCSTESGAETEFPEAALLTEAEWTARTAGKKDQIYMHLKRARVYTEPQPGLDRAASQKLLLTIEKSSAGILDFAAFTIAARVLAEAGDATSASDLSIVKCREIFDAATPEIQASLLATFLGTPANRLVDAARLGENLLRAMIDKGMERYAQAFQAFGDRPRR